MVRVLAHSRADRKPYAAEQTTRAVVLGRAADAAISNRRPSRVPAGCRSTLVRNGANPHGDWTRGLGY